MRETPSHSATHAPNGKSQERQAPVSSFPPARTRLPRSPPLTKTKNQLLSSIHPPTFTFRQASERRTVIKSPGRLRARPRAANNHLAISATQDPTMATTGANLEALANLQADKLQKIIKSLQGIVAARTGTNTPTTPQPPHIPAATTGEEEAIL